MAGHSKWHKIRHQKGSADKKRGALFSRLAKAITVAARDGDDPAMNFTLRLAIEKAKQANMPKDNIERAIARGSGKDGGAQLNSALYEMMGPGGVSILIEALSDNTNRTITEIKIIGNKFGGNLEAKVLWQFERLGVIRAKELLDERAEEFELLMIEQGVKDILIDEEVEIHTELTDLKDIEAKVADFGLVVDSAGPEYIASQKIAVSDEDGEKLLALLDALEDNDDITNVFTNVE